MIALLGAYFFLLIPLSLSFKILGKSCAACSSLLHLFSLGKQNGKTEAPQDPLQRLSNLSI